MWTSHTRTGYEAACLRAMRELNRALEHADLADDEGAGTDLININLYLSQVVRASQESRKGLLKRPMRGQIDITGAEVGPRLADPAPAAEAQG
jgi:hypothetical protein